MLLLSRLRLALARRPWLYWLLVAGCAAIVWSIVSNAQSRLDEQRKQWGETRRVWIAEVDIAPGDLVRSVARDYPSAMVSATALKAEPVGAIATTAIAAGEVLVPSDVATDADRSLPPGWVVFALRRADSPALHDGDGVAIFGSGQRWCDGIIVAVSDDNIEVGVPPECADAVSVQIAAGTIVLAMLA